MKKILAVVMVLALSGCSLFEVNEKSEQLSKPVVVVAKSIEEAEPIIKSIEAVTGRSISEETIGKGEAASGTAKTVLNTGAGIATALGQPGIGTLLAGLAALAGGIGSFFHRRRAQDIAKAASRAADKREGGGSVLMAEAAKLGVADVINKVYQESK